MFPEIRLRRLRQNENIRRMLDIPLPGPSKMIWPVFIVKGKKIKDPIKSMPGQFRYSIDQLLIDLEPMVKLGIGGILVFGQIENDKKDPIGKVASHENNITQKAIRLIKAAFPDLLITADICLCAYTDHGHCGLLNNNGLVDNDKTLKALSDIAVSMCNSGVDIIAPSAMMDGQVQFIRKNLDNQGYHEKIIMSYSTKFSSSLYDPFRDAENSSPNSGNRRNYQTSYGNLDLALRESKFDEKEGADILMVKPSLMYLDVLSKIRSRTNIPIAAYNVSGEYSMMMASSLQNWGNLKDMVREYTTAMIRAGADIIITYWANQYEEIFKD